MAVAGGDCAGAGFDTGFYDCEAEACSAGFPGARGVDAIEGVEDLRQRVRRDSGAVVGDNYSHFFAGGRCGVDLYGAGVTGVVKGVADEIGEGALEQFRVGDDAEIFFHLDFDVGGSGGFAFDDFFQEGMKIDWLEIYAHPE